MQGLVSGWRWLRRQLTGVLVVVVGVAASVAAFAVSDAAVHHDDRILLRQDATQGSLVLGSLVGQVPQPVADLAAGVGRGGTLAPGWVARAASAAGHDGYSALAVVRLVGGRLDVVAGAGTLHGDIAAGPGAPALAAAAGRRPTAFAVTSSAGGRWLDELVGSPVVPPGEALYLQRPLPTVTFPLADLPGHPFSGLQAALYVGSETPADLVLSTTGRVPFGGLQATTVVASGAVLGVKPVLLRTRPARATSPGDIILVVRPSGPLVGGSAAVEPWVLLGGGIAATAAVGGLLQLAERRRRRAEQLAVEIIERNDALQAARADQARNDARFAAMVRSSSDLTTVTDESGVITYQSPSSDRVLGVSPERLVGTALAAHVHPGDRDAWQRAVDRVVAVPGSQAVVECRLHTGDGGEVTVESQVANLLHDDAVGGILFNSRDVTERLRLQDELRHQAFHDSLTGLANRALLADRVGLAARRLARTGEALGLLLLDIDDFKAVNDGIGHGAGDELLRAVAGRLQSVASAGDTVARLGGDEFGMLVEIAAPGEAAAIAERVARAFDDPVPMPTGPADVRVSVGVVTTTDADADADDLLRSADIAMYAAKGAGKARVEVFHPTLRDEVVERLALESDLSAAITNGELFVHYQALVDIETTVPTGVEALMRWHHPRRGVVPPSSFIPVAERSGLIVALGRWLLDQACHGARLLHQRTERPDLHVAVNVSARQLDDAGFVDDVAGALSRSGLRPQLLTLEVTESVFMADPDRSAAVLRRLKDLGVKLSIDDFGTGFSSLGYLQHLPLDELKIDRSFVVAGGPTRPPPLVHSIVRMADDLGLATVAEGIETELQLHHMRAAGCRSGQGYLFSRPSTIERLLGEGSVFAHRSGPPGFQGRQRRGGVVRG